MKATSIFTVLIASILLISCELYQDAATTKAKEKESTRLDNVEMDEYGRIVIVEDKVTLCNKVKKSKYTPFEVDTLTIVRWGGGTAVRKNNLRARLVLRGLIEDAEFELKSIIYRGNILKPTAKVGKPNVFDALYIKPPGNNLDFLSVEEQNFVESSKKNDYDDVSIMYRYGRKCYNYKTKETE